MNTKFFITHHMRLGYMLLRHLSELPQRRSGTLCPRSQIRCCWNEVDDGLDDKLAPAVGDQVQLGVLDLLRQQLVQFVANFLPPSCCDKIA